MSDSEPERTQACSGKWHTGNACTLSFAYKSPEVAHLRRAEQHRGDPLVGVKRTRVPWARSDAIDPHADTPRRR